MSGVLPSVRTNGKTIRYSLSRSGAFGFAAETIPVVSCRIGPDGQFSDFQTRNVSTANGEKDAAVNILVTTSGRYFTPPLPRQGYEVGSATVP